VPNVVLVSHSEFLHDHLSIVEYEKTHYNQSKNQLHLLTRTTGVITQCCRIICFPLILQQVLKTYEDECVRSEEDIQDGSNEHSGENR